MYRNGIMPPGGTAPMTPGAPGPHGPAPMAPGTPGPHGPAGGTPGPAAGMQGGPGMAMLQSQSFFYVDPYVVQTLTTVMGKRVVVETPRGAVRGMLAEVKPDHIIVRDEKDAVFIIRIAQIILVMPT